MRRSGGKSQLKVHYHSEDMSAAGHDALAIDEKKLMRKIDYRIIPWLSLLYLLSYLDRSTIGNARVSTCSFLSSVPYTDSDVHLVIPHGS